MTEERQSVRGLKDFFEQKNRSKSQAYVPKGVKQAPEANQQADVAKEKSELLNELEEQLPDDVGKLKDMISRLRYDNHKISYELRDAKGAYNRMISEYQELKSQSARISSLSQRTQELEQQNTALKARLMLAQEKIEEQDSQSLPRFSLSPQRCEQPKPELKHQGVQVDLLNQLVEQNRLLLERLNEKPDPQGKELIIVNTLQAQQLKASMEKLKQDLVAKLNFYNQLIQNRQLTEMKLNIKVDIQDINEVYLGMFRSVNRPISHVNQIGKILSPVYERELNEFLVSISEFLDRFSQVASLNLK